MTDRDPVRTASPPPEAATSDGEVVGTHTFGEITRSADSPNATISYTPDGLAPEGYVLIREIARGGMGRVLAARDLALDREVAIKVLLPERSAAEAERRFIRESKITAKLPHPGIPPVYALGQLPDGQPFLAMKLIQGRTLADELLARESPFADLPRFVQVFEQVCQAVGFAHSQGIIHRDLKPANVMVGAFGEVQVMDWGLAKQLTEGAEAPAARNEPDDAGQTHSGAVMGTPAYMAPEQARGEIDKLDARTDAFSLGAILCEILTGGRPFLGQSSLEVLKRAAAGELSEAFKRLDSCGADADLIAIAKRCLSRAPADRPADGAAVASLIAEHRVGVETRLRKSEADRAAAAMEAREQRKRRRVQLALGAAVVLIFAGIAAFAWNSDREATKKRNEDELRAGGERARMSLNATAVAGLLERSEAALRADDASAASVSVVEAESRSADGGAEEHAERTRGARRDLDLLVELDRIDEMRWESQPDGAYLPQPQIVAEWRKAFERIGVPGPDSKRTIDGLAVRERAIGALEYWFTYALVAEERAAPYAILAAVDPDHYRDSVRLARSKADRDGLLRELSRPELFRQPPRFVAPYGRLTLMPRERRIAVLDAAAMAHMRHFGIQMEAGWAHVGLGGKLLGECVPWFRAAISIRPHSPGAWSRLGLDLGASGKDVDAAILCHRESLKLNPMQANEHLMLAYCHRQKNDFKQAVAECREYIRMLPNASRGYYDLYMHLMDAGDRAGALEAMERYIQLEPESAAGRFHRGAVHARFGEHRAAIASYDEAMRIKPAFYTYHMARGDSHRELKDWTKAAADYSEAARLAPNDGAPLFQLGWACVHGGNPPGAIDAFRRLTKLTPDDPWAHGNLGIALFNAHNYSGAADAYRTVVKLDPKSAKFRIEQGNILLAKGDVDEAILAFRIALQLDPDSKAAKDGLDRARKAMEKPKQE